jgi:hypothetical protein
MPTRLPGTPHASRRVVCPLPAHGRSYQDVARHALQPHPRPEGTMRHAATPPGGASAVGAGAYHRAGQRHAIRADGAPAFPNRFLGTIQIGITPAGFLASATAAVSLAEPLTPRLGFFWRQPGDSQGAGQLALVVDERSAVSGIVTLEDLLKEIVGEIYDETDRDVMQARRFSDGSLLLPGTFPVCDRRGGQMPSEGGRPQPGRRSRPRSVTADMADRSDPAAHSRPGSRQPPSTRRSRRGRPRPRSDGRGRARPRPAQPQSGRPSAAGRRAVAVRNSQSRRGSTAHRKPRRTVPPDSTTASSAHPTVTSATCSPEMP